MMDSDKGNRPNSDGIEQIRFFLNFTQIALALLTMMSLMYGTSMFRGWKINKFKYDIISY